MANGNRTYGRSVREGAANTRPQVPQNCAYGLFIALHLAHARAHVAGVSGYNHKKTTGEISVHLNITHNDKRFKR